MKVTQISTILNDVFGEVLGETGVISEDLSNIVSAGQIITASSTFADQFENYAGKIVDKVGRTVFADRVYRAKDLGIWRDAFEYGSVLEKIRCDVGDYKNNCEWDLAKDANSNGESDYNDDLANHIQELFKFVPAKVQAKYFNSKTTFKTVISITRKQLKSAFNSASDMARFIGMIENRVMSKMEIAKDQLQRRVIANLMGEKIYGGKFVDLKALYTAEIGGTVPDTLAEALNTPSVLRFMAKKISQDREFMTIPSTIYTDGDFYTHTPESESRLLILSDLDKGLEFNLYGDTYNEEFVKLAGYTSVPFWQGTGTTMNIADRAAINIRTSASHDVNQGYIVGVLFDRNAAMVCNEDPDVRSQYNPDGNFTNYFYTFDCSYYNDFDENAIVYTWGDVTIVPFVVVPTLAKGTNDGTTKVTVKANDATNDSLYAIVTDEAKAIAPGTVLKTTGWTALTSETAKDNVAANAGQYLNVAEVVTATGVINSFYSVKLTASNIK